MGWDGMERMGWDRVGEGGLACTLMSTSSTTSVHGLMVTLDLNAGQVVSGNWSSQVSATDQRRR